jgi:hypothetical protein
MVWCVIPLEQVLACDILTLEHGQLQSLNLTVLKCKCVPNQYLLQWNNTLNHTNIRLYATVVLLLMCANSTRKILYRANHERNIKYSVHLVGPE